jgi:hypothetical protein
VYALTYVEIDVDRCSLTYGVPPCQATLVGSPVTGARKCFNTLATCQDLANFTDEGVTLRFAVDALYLPSDIPCNPCLTNVDFSPAIVSLGVDLGQRASLKIQCKDHRDSDTGPGGDPYLADRDYNPFTQGTYFGKFRARHPYLRGKNLRLIRGEVGQALDDMETRHFIIDSFDGPLPDGSYSIIAKDVLKLADGDRAQAPTPSNGFLASDISDSATTADLSPTDIGDEYPAEGYLAIGGTEIVAFTRDPYGGLNANTQLYYQFNGADGSTTITDSSGNGRNGSANGNAQLDTADKKFGTASLYLDGTGDFVSVSDNDAWTPAGNFTIDVWLKPETTGTTRTLFCQVVTGSGNNEHRLRLNDNGSLAYDVFNGASNTISMSSAAGVVSNLAWQHIALTRSGNDFKLFVNGVVVATLTDADAIPNFAAPFRIGGAGTAGTTSPYKGWIDGFRFQNGDATWTADFSDLLPVPYAASSDAVAITRGQLGTTAEEHSAQDRVQHVLHYDSQMPSAILADLLENYAGVSASYIPIDDWAEEDEAFLNRLYTGTVADPTDVSKLAAEIIEQAALAVWWDDEAQVLRLQVLRAISTEAARFTEDNTIEGTIQSKDQPERRVSQVITYFGRINPLKPLDDPENYRSMEATVDTESESNYGSPAIKKIFSRWIPAFGRAVATSLNERLIARYKNPPRRLNLDLFRDGITDVTLGQGARIESWFIQDDTGAPTDIPGQLTRLNPQPDRFSLEFEEMAGVDVLDIGDRTVIVDSDTYNFNLRSVHDEIYSTPESGDEVLCIIRSGVIVGSTSTTLPSFDVGSWPSGVVVTLTVDGRIQGKGGKGGHGAKNGGSATNGTSGGDALYTRYAIALNGTGEIWGGGGGGGGGGSTQGGGGGGGGQGFDTNIGGNDGGLTSKDGNESTTEAPGAGGRGGGGGGDGGNGGAEGAAGNNGSSSGGTGGAAGKAIDGNSFVTESGSLNIAGSRVN